MGASSSNDGNKKKMTNGQIAGIAVGTTVAVAAATTTIGFVADSQTKKHKYEKQLGSSLDPNQRKMPYDQDRNLGHDDDYY